MKALVTAIKADHGNGHLFVAYYTFGRFHIWVYIWLVHESSGYTFGYTPGYTFGHTPGYTFGHTPGYTPGQYIINLAAYTYNIGPPPRLRHSTSGSSKITTRTVHRRTMKAMKATAKQRQLALKAKPRSETVKVYATKQLKDLVKRARGWNVESEAEAIMNVRPDESDLRYCIW